MADVPPPYEPPLADDAPDQLVRFLYFLTRDFVPFGVIDHALHRARTETYPLQGSDHRAAYADVVARELVYGERGTAIGP